MNAFGLQKNRFHQKACEKRNKRSEVNPNSFSPQKQLDNLTVQKNSFYLAELNASYSNLTYDQENNNIISIPKSINMDLFLRLNKKYQKDPYE